MPKRRHTFLPSSWSRYGSQMIVDRAKFGWNPKLRYPNHIWSKHHKVDTGETGYNWRQSAIPSKVLTGTTIIALLLLVPQCYPPPLYTKNVLTMSLCPIQEIPNNSKGNSSFSARCAPYPQVWKWWKKLKSKT